MKTFREYRAEKFALGRVGRTTPFNRDYIDVKNEIKGEFADGSWYAELLLDQNLKAKIAMCMEELYNLVDKSEPDRELVDGKYVDIV